MQKVRCALCNSDDTETLFLKGSLKGKGELDLINVICKKCGLVYINPRLTEKEYHQFYRKSSSVGSDFTFEDAVKIFKERGKRKGKRILSFIVPYLKKNYQVLDVGCGFGALSRVIKDSIGCSIEGMEPSSMASKFVQEYHHLNVFHGSFNQYYQQYSKKKFDFIILHNVLEHFLEPLKSLSQIKSLLNPGGYIYLELPDITGFRGSFASFFKLAHPYTFSPYTFHLVVQRMGMKIIKSNFWGPGRMQFIIIPIENPEKPLPFYLFQKGNDYKSVIRHVKWTAFKYPVKESLSKLLRPAAGILSKSFRAGLKMLLKRI